MNKQVETLKPFTRFLMTIGQLPSSYLISMTYEEQLLWFCNFLEKEVIPTVNNNAEAVIELQNYVQNYFENLDIQEEVDHKLDEMVESGELQEIISAYLDSQAILGYDTINDLKAATNLVSGSLIRTMGYNNYMDGKGSFYRIRNILVSDVIDNVNIISLTNYNDLIAERVYTFNEVHNEYVEVNTLDEFLTQIAIENNGIEICKEITLTEPITPANNVKIKNGTINYSGDESYIIDTDDNNFSINNVTLNITKTNAPDNYNTGVIKNNEGVVNIKNCIFNVSNITCINITAHSSKINCENNKFNYTTGNNRCYVYYSTPRQDISNIESTSNIMIFANNKINNFSVGMLLDLDNSLITNNIFTNVSAPIACLKVRNTIISNNVITGFVSNAIALGNGTDDLIENVSVIGNSLDGNNLETNEQTSQVHGINIYKQGGDSDPTGETHPNIGKSKYITITGNTVKNCYASGIFAYTNGNCVISSNVCTNNQTGILESGLLTTNIGNIVISSNYCCYNSSMGIGIGSSSSSLSDIVCSNNICNNNANGIYCGGNNNNIVISNNICNNNSEYGLNVNGASSCQINGNCLKNNTSHQLNLSLRTNECELIGNDISRTNSINYVGDIRPKIIKENIGVRNNISSIQENYIFEGNTNTVNCSIPLNMQTSWYTDLIYVTVFADRLNSNTDHYIKKQAFGYACYRNSAGTSFTYNNILSSTIFETSANNITITPSYNSTTKNVDFNITCSNSNVANMRVVIERADGTVLNNNILN